MESIYVSHNQSVKVGTGSEPEEMGDSDNSGSGPATEPGRSQGGIGSVVDGGILLDSVFIHMSDC